ncbi:hypothetical protein GCM10027592_60280 [Spirosoma flavus]
MQVDPDIKKMVITYDLQDVRPTDSLYVQIETASGRVIEPKAITGAIGKGLRPGPNQVAYWDVVRDSTRLNESIQARILFSRPAPPPPVAPAPVAVTEKPKPESQNLAIQPKAQPVVAVRKKSPIPIIGYVATAGLGAYSFVLASAISKDSDTYNSKQFVTSAAEKAEYDDKLASLNSRKSTLTIVAGAAIAVGVATTIYTFIHKPKSSRITLVSPPGTRSTNLGVALNF